MSGSGQSEYERLQFYVGEEEEEEEENEEGDRK